MDIIRIAAATTLIIGTGLIHGEWISRWGVSPALSALAARFQSVPMVIGDWTGKAFELDPEEKRMAGAEACLTRIYTQAGSRASISVMLLGGLPGKIATHTPDVCYSVNGYIASTPVPYEYRPGPDGPLARFRTVLATREGPKPSALRIFWSWNASEGWSAPDDARWRFGSKPTLCKLYVIRETGGATVEPGRDPCNDFFRVFLPELDRRVFSGPA
jgi:hypothetical protein